MCVFYLFKSARVEERRILQKGCPGNKSYVCGYLGTSACDNLISKKKIVVKVCLDIRIVIRIIISYVHLSGYKL